MHLTARETQVLFFIGLGRTTKEIATLLRLSVHTIGNHRKCLCSKLDCHSTAELAAFAARIFKVRPVDLQFRTA